MNKYDFINETDRTKVSSIKTNKKFIRKFFGLDYNEDTISLWVSEMDFKMSPNIQEALVNRINLGGLGYTTSSFAYFSSIINWFKNRYGAEIEKNWILYSHGTVPAIRTAIRLFTEPGDSIIIQPPVYGQFRSTIKDTGRKVVKNALINTVDGYDIDFIGFEELATKDETKMFILCNPHNPTGEVWSENDIKKLVNICEENNVLVFADEVHAEIKRSDVVFTSTSKFGSENVITANALSKGFNITGMHITHLIIKNDDLRKRYSDYNGFSSISPLALEATIAAYTDAEEWLEEVSKVIDDNFKYMKKFIDTRIPKLKFTIPKGTYLAWLDFSNYNLGIQKILEHLATDASLVLESGLMFGEEGSGFARMTIGTPLENLKEVLTRLELGLSKL